MCNHGVFKIEKLIVIKLELYCINYIFSGVELTSLNAIIFPFLNLK